MTEARKALIIASFQYEDADIRQLMAPHNDAGALAKVLENPAIGGFDVQIHINEPSYKVAQAIEAFFADSKRDELLLLYFSGHGMKDEDGQLYLVTVDTKRKLLRSTAISAKFISEVMEMSRSRRQVLLLDCCYSGAFARGILAKGDTCIGTKEEFGGRGRVVIAASDAMQYSFEGNNVEGEGIRSIFTSKLVRGLESGEADLDGDGSVSLDELYDYVYGQVCDEMPQQRPMKHALDVQGDIIIANNPSPVIKPAKLPIELQQAMENPIASIREGTLTELSNLLHCNHRGLALASLLALKKLSGDDSRKVSNAASRILDAIGPDQSFDPKFEPENKSTMIIQDNSKVFEKSKTTADSKFNRNFNECHQCKAKVALNAIFCPNCGGLVAAQQPEAYSKRCAVCGSSINPEALFCGKCGNDLST